MLLRQHYSRRLMGSSLEIKFPQLGPSLNSMLKPNYSSAEPYLRAAGRIRCVQCSAQSKQTGQRCRAPASKDKTKCRFHGGRSTGPRTAEGRQRCADAKTIHGRETRDARSERSLTAARLAVLESAGHAIGLMSGPRTRGRKPHRTTEALPELQQALSLILLGELSDQGPGSKGV